MTPAPTPLDLAALRGWIEAGIRMDKEHALEVIARAEAAEAKIAAVRATISEYGEQPHSTECGSGDCCRCTLDDFRAALDGTA